jgi:FMN phosphatase YigB (HAD superfamily)
LFCDGFYKGPALKAFLQGKPDLKVKKIVFVDDKLKNVESVKVAAQELGINFVGIRYGHTDVRTKAYALDEKSLMLAESLVNQGDTKKRHKALQHLSASA